MASSTASLLKIVAGKHTGAVSLDFRNPMSAVGVREEAFYACKPYADIYEEAFGKPLSFKDPERVKLCERLDRWIEKDFSKTAKGKSALKQGAARR